MAPTARRAIGSFAILAYLVAYIGVAATLGGHVVGFGQIAALVFFAVAGVAWVFPLRPLFKWMNR
jgi:hypothetical protein